MAVALLLFVVQQAVATLEILTAVERERDGWQRPQEILQQLDVHPGNVVVDLGSGAGYFTLKLAPMVGPNGRVLAVGNRAAPRRAWLYDHRERRNPDDASHASSAQMELYGAATRIALEREQTV